MKRFNVPAISLGLFFLAGPAPQAFSSTTVGVQVGDNFFRPASTNINQGDSVRWTWIGIGTHSTTGPGTPALWDSGLTSQSGFTFTHTFPSAGSFAYVCTLHGAIGMRGTITVSAVGDVPPTVSLTAPTNNSTFAAPWTGTIHANTSDSDGTVTRVDFFANSTLLGRVTNPPPSLIFNVTNLAAGNYNLKAVATDNGGATNTSAVVSIQVLTPDPISLSSPQRISDSAFQFNYTATPGLSYVIDRSSTLPGFSSIATNPATSNPMTFIDNNASAPLYFYSVHLLPNP
jgi:plastocyanin